METLEGVPSTGRYHSKGKFDIRFVHSVLKELEQGLPPGAACAKYNISKAGLYGWIKQYAHQYNFPRWRKDLPLQDKRTIIRAVNTGQLSVKEAALSYGVSAKSIQTWQKIFTGEKEELSVFNNEQLNKKKTKQPPTTNNASLEQLQQQLAEAQLKIAALNTLIDVAEEQLKINIRKKPGARQS